jgi:hypothetical protein
MDQVSIMKRQLRTEEWHKRIQECQASGVPVTHWCKQNGICEQTYYKYLKRFREEIIESLPVPVVPEEEKPTVFKKLEIQSPIPDTRPAVIIRLLNATLEINEGTSQQTVQAVLLALQSIC